MITRSIRHATVTLVGMALQTACTFEPTGGYRSIAIDPATLRVELRDPVPLEFNADGKAKAMLGSYYQIFTGQGGGTSIEHYVQNTSAQPRDRYSSLEMGADRILAKSSTTRALLRGPFGTVYSVRSCFYNLPLERYPNSLEIRLYANEAEHEPPMLTNDRTSAATGTLTDVNVIRVLRGGPEYLVVSALYSAEGHLRRVWVDGAQDGNWIHSSLVEEAGRDAIAIDASGPSRRDVTVMTPYGLPATISVDNAVTHRPVGLQSSATLVERDVINVLYDYGAWIVQDEYQTSGGHQTRYLTYAQTVEGSVTDARCAERFREARAKGLAWKE